MLIDLLFFSKVDLVVGWQC